MRRTAQMLDFPKFLTYLLVMAGVTYATRLLPIIFIRKKIENRFIRSFLYYVPYSVLSAMTVPAIFYSTGYILSAIVGAAVAVLLAYKKQSLIVVAAGASAAVLLAELLMPLVPALAF